MRTVYGQDIIGGAAPSVYSDADIIGANFTRVGEGKPSPFLLGPAAAGPVSLASAEKAMQTTQQFQQLPSSPQVRPSSANEHLRRLVLPIGNASIPAGGSQTFTIQPQRPQRVDRLVVTQYDAAFAPVRGLLVTSVLVGTDPQFSAAGTVDSVMFAPDAFDTSLRGATANPGITISVTVFNPTAGPINAFIAALGEALD